MLPDVEPDDRARYVDGSLFTPGVAVSCRNVQEPSGIFDTPLSY